MRCTYSCCDVGQPVEVIWPEKRQQCIKSSSNKYRLGANCEFISILLKNLSDKVYMQNMSLLVYCTARDMVSQSSNPSILNFLIWHFFPNGLEPALNKSENIWDRYHYSVELPASDRP